MNNNLAVFFACFCRESIYRLLPQTTPENIGKNFEQYTIDPGTRYPNLISSCVRPHQVRGSDHFARIWHLSLRTGFILNKYTQLLDFPDCNHCSFFHPVPGASLVHQWRAELLLSGACCYHTTACQCLQTRYVWKELTDLCVLSLCTSYSHVSDHPALSREWDISGWGGNYFKFGTNVHLDSGKNFVVKGHCDFTQNDFWP